MRSGTVLNDDWMDVIYCMYFLSYLIHSVQFSIILTYQILVLYGLLIHNFPSKNFYSDNQKRNVKFVLVFDIFIDLYICTHSLSPIWTKFALP